MRRKEGEEGGQGQGGWRAGSRGSSNSLTSDRGVKLWSSPESQNRLISPEREKKKSENERLPPLSPSLSPPCSFSSGLNQSAELIRVC